MTIGQGSEATRRTQGDRVGVQNVELAVRGLARLNAGLAAEGRAQRSLVLAGGYDERLPEARRYMQELRLLVDELGLAKKVGYRTSWLHAA